ncbi:AAA family ATPase [Asticcacaulis sp. EMRT-3]|uniref:AAA family ATPase n=1 Tax=Asticcacaulis sp. EMRT-3 TaxID=3040349 RepID=UPI0024AFBD8C|nr:AAA family ATPase [Asticcacaulis sp. EMRT-3]MDI7776333.1 AAA family ATPase [Asticcacaulis sp. EMRT-3]
MKTLAIVSQKGGVGKTTVAVHIAVAAARAGYSVAIIDLDPQATAAQWADWRNEKATGEGAEEPNPVVVAAPHARLGPTLKEAEKMGVDLVILDSPPAADSAAVAAARAADLVLIPTRASAFDLHAIKTTAELVRVAQKPAAVLLNAVPARASALIEEVAAVIHSLNLTIAPVCLVDRAALRHAVINGLTAAEFEPLGKAADEVRAVYRWVCGRLDMPTTAKKTKSSQSIKGAA